MPQPSSYRTAGEHADGFADLFAPDAVMEFCFHGPPGGEPVRLEGREVDQ